MVNISLTVVTGATVLNSKHNRYVSEYPSKSIRLYLSKYGCVFWQQIAQESVSEIGYIWALSARVPVGDDDNSAGLLFF